MAFGHLYPEPKVRRTFGTRSEGPLLGLRPRNKSKRRSEATKKARFERSENRRNGKIRVRGPTKAEIQYKITLLKPGPKMGGRPISQARGGNQKEGPKKLLVIVISAA